MPSVGPAGQEDVEGHSEGQGVEAPEGPLGQASVEGASDGSGTGLLAGHKGQMHGNAETPGDAQELYVESPSIWIALARWQEMEGELHDAFCEEQEEGHIMRRECLRRAAKDLFVQCYPCKHSLSELKLCRGWH